MQAFMVHFSDAGQPGRTVLTTFAPTLSTSCLLYTSELPTNREV